MTTEQEKALEKIKKLLAKEKSTDPNEAAVCLEKAILLMKKYGLTSQDVIRSEVVQGSVKMGSFKTAPTYLGMLVSAVEKATRTVSYLSIDPFSFDVCFIGDEPSVKIAIYAYQSLSRKLLKARKAFYGRLNPDAGRWKKSQAANAYAEGWTTAVFRKIERLMPDVEVPAIVRQVAEEELSGAKSAHTRGADVEQASIYRNLGYDDGLQVELFRAVEVEERKGLN